MDESRQELLARSRCSKNEHGRVRLCERRGLLECRYDFGVVGNHPEFRYSRPNVWGRDFRCTDLSVANPNDWKLRTPQVDLRHETPFCANKPWRSNVKNARRKLSR